MSKAESKPAAARPAKAAVRNAMTIDTIVATALKGIQKEGLAGLSMRQLAATLDVTPTAIYHHVKDKDQLLDLCAERILASIPEPNAALPWPQRLKVLLLEQQRVFLRVPGLAKYLLANRQSSMASLQWAEAVLRVMHDAGFAPPQSFEVLMSVTFFVNPITLMDDKLPVKVTTPVLHRNRVNTVLKTQGDKFPCLGEVLPYLTGSSYEAHFEIALDRMITSLQRELGTPAARAASGR